MYTKINGRVLQKELKTKTNGNTSIMLDRREKNMEPNGKKTHAINSEKILFYVEENFFDIFVFLPFFH